MKVTIERNSKFPSFTDLKVGELFLFTDNDNNAIWMKCGPKTIQQVVGPCGYPGTTFTTEGNYDNRPIYPIIELVVR